MISKFIRYLFPPRGMYRVPRHITAAYRRADMSKEEQLIIMAGLARDPPEAKRVFERIQARHGEHTYKYIQLELKRRRSQTIKERLLGMFRAMLGETEPRRYERRRKQEAIVKVRYRFTDDKKG